MRARSLRAVLRNRDLRLLETAFFGFGLNESGTWVAILVYAFRQGGATEAGLIAVLQLVPAAIVAPFAGALGDRFARDRLLVAGYAAQAITFGATGAALLAGAPTVVVYISAVVAATTVTVTRPAHGAILPSLARSPDELTAANVVSGTIESGTVLAGPALAGVLMGISGPGLVFAAFGSVLGLSAILALGIRSLPPLGARDRRVLQASLQGFRNLARDRRTRLVVTLVAVKSVVIGALDVLIVVIAIGVLRIGDAGAGYLSAALGAGGLLGAIATFALVGRRRLAPPLVEGLGLLGAPVTLIGALAAPAAAGALLAICGAGYSLADVAGRTLLQRIARGEMLSRVFGMLEGLHLGGLALGSLVAPALVATVGITPALVVVGAFLPILAILAWRGLDAADASVADAADRVRALAAVPIFAPLPAPAIEALGAGIVEVAVDAGDPVIREGDHGDRFYLIVEGTFRIERASRPVATLGPGDSFGEIALLHDVPRTASVLAEGPGRLYALERDDFLAAVTGHPSSHSAAEQVAEERRPAEDG